MARRKVVFAGPADFVDRNGTVIELGMRVSVMDGGIPVGEGDVCMFDEDSSQPIGVVSDIDSYLDIDDVRWLSPEDVEVF